MQDRKGWQPKSPVALVRDHVVGENALEALTPSEEHLNCFILLTSLDPHSATALGLKA